MKSYFILTFLLLLVSENTYSQYRPKNYIKQDLSHIFTNSAMIGIIGDDYSRIDIYFTEAKKINDSIYEIKGASRTKMSIICPLKGKIYIENFIPYDSFRMDECGKIEGSICGHYTLIEYGDEKNSGIFSGWFRESYWVDGNQVKKGIIETEARETTLSEYQGKWTSPKGLVKECSWVWPWGSMIPNRPYDFSQFNECGEWVVQPKYRKNGWENRHNSYHNKYISKEKQKKARQKEKEKWWERIK